MNNLKIYISICRSALTRKLNDDAECEIHHIFPESIYGKNNLTVKLTTREHCLVHWLLYKSFLTRYGVDSVKTKKMSMAFHWMIYGKSKNTPRVNIRPSTRMYASARLAAKKSKLGNKRNDMKGKSFFGASSENVKKAIEESANSKRGKSIKYPSTRSSRGSIQDNTRTLISNSRLKTYEKYLNMSQRDFEDWINNQNLFIRDGRKNSNVTRAIIARGENVDMYYGAKI